MSELDNWVDTAVHRARELGKQHGSNAAGWWIQDALTKNQHSAEQARTILRMEENCEAQFPTADLSGQWAEGPLPQDVLTHAFGTGGWDSYSPEYKAEVDNEALNAYEQAFNDAARDECLNACRNELAS